MLTAQTMKVNIVVPMEGMSVGLPLGKDAEEENKHTVTKNVERDA